MARTTFEYTGTLASWNDERGFGFVDLHDGSRPLFVHVSAFVDRSVRPLSGDEIRFGIEATSDDRSRATRVHIVRRAAGERMPAVRLPAVARSRAAGGSRANRRQRSRGRPGAAASVVVLALFAAIWVAAAVRWGVPDWVSLLYGVAGIVAFLTYWSDKRAARAGARRVSEATLLTVGLLGGWPGAILAQQLFRHKTSKRSFRTAFWTTVVVNIVAFVAVVGVLAHPELIAA